MTGHEDMNVLVRLLCQVAWHLPILARVGRASQFPKTLLVYSLYMVDRNVVAGHVPMVHCVPLYAPITWT